MAENKVLKDRFVQISAKDLPLHCPTPDVMKWNAHPRVYLTLGPDGETLCPYCGTRYKLVGPPPRGGHGN